MKKTTLYNEYPAYLKTDVLPFEIPVIFSNDDFYDYIIKNTRMYRKTLNSTKLNNIKSSIPLSFNSYVRYNKKRKISLINPFSYMYILKFIKNYENIYLNEFKNSNYSIRYPKSKVNNYQYKRRVVRTNTYIEEVDKIEKKNGTYYKVTPYKRSYEFENSNFFQKQTLKYKYFNKMDIKGCFNSIYTHSYKWLITSNFKESISLKRSLNMYPIIDELLQSINNHKTNGILIGPEFMRLIAEILLSGIDKEVNEEIIKKGYQGVKIYRFIDDFYIFSKKEENIKSVKNIIEKKYGDYQLVFNDRKFIEKNEIFILNEWYTEITYMLESIDFKKFYTPSNKKIILDILVKFKGERSTVVTYIISIVVNKLNEEIKDIQKFSNQTSEILEKNKEVYNLYEELYRKFIEDKPIIKKEELFEKFEYLKKSNLEKITISEKRLFKIFEELIFYLKLSPKYVNTLKILNLSIECLILGEELNNDNRFDYKILLKNVFTREMNIFEDFDGNYDDVLNILILFEYLEIYLGKKDIEEKILNGEDNNLLRMTYIYRYCKNTCQKEYEDIIEKIEEKVRIKEEINYKKISEHEDVWKLLLFKEINKGQYEMVPDEMRKEFPNVYFILSFLDSGGFFVDYEPINNINDLKILNKKIYYKSLVSINY